MVVVTISKKVKECITTSKHEFKSRHNAFMVAHNAARYLWLDYSDASIPSGNLIDDRWHFEPSAGVTMDVVIDYEELM